MKILASSVIAAVVACKPPVDDGSTALTYAGVDDYLKVAINFIGANCDKGGVIADRSHYLDGPNGELMLEQASRLDRGAYGFSGDAIMDRTKDNLDTKMEDIEAKCRRLILSLDVAAGTYPHITFTKGSARANPQSSFESDFGNNGYGEISCIGWSDYPTYFCSFANIKGKNSMIRYFAYLEPDKSSKSIEAKVGVSDKHSYMVAVLDTHDPQALDITLKGIYRETPWEEAGEEVDNPELLGLLSLLERSSTAFLVEDTLRKVAAPEDKILPYARQNSDNRYNEDASSSSFYRVVYQSDNHSKLFATIEALRYLNVCAKSRFHTYLETKLCLSNKCVSKHEKLPIVTDSSKANYTTNLYLWVGKDGNLKIGQETATTIYYYSVVKRGTSCAINSQQDHRYQLLSQ